MKLVCEVIKLFKQIIINKLNYNRLKNKKYKNKNIYSNQIIIKLCLKK